MSLFNAQNDDTRVFIMHPRRRTTFNIGNPQSANYRVKIGLLKDKLKAILGSQVPIVLFNYRAIDTKTLDPAMGQALPEEQRDPDLPQLFTNQRGVAAFRWDPDARGRGVSGWRIFLEHHVFQDTDAPVGAVAQNGIPD